MKITRNEMWTWWTHKKYGIKMQVTQVYRGKVNLWDAKMQFRWTGSIASFQRQWVKCKVKSQYKFVTIHSKTYSFAKK